MNYAEAAGMEQQVGGANGVFYFSGTANPGQTGETNTGGFGGSGVELVVRIDHSADFAAPGGGGKNVQEAGSAAGGARAGNFGDGTAR
jgi:hypothetical protein